MTKERHAILALLLLLFIDGMGQGLIFPILTNAIINAKAHSVLHLATHLERSIWYGVIVFSFFFTWFFGAAILGDISDTVGRKKALLICLVGAFLGYLLSAFAFWAHSVWLLLFGRIIYGFTAGSQPIAQAAITDVSSPEEKSKNLGFILLAITLGIMAGPIIGGFLSDTRLVSWFRDSTPLYFACFLTLFNIFYLYFFFNETIAKKEKLTINFMLPITIFVDAFRDKSLRFLALCFTLLQIGWSIYYLYISLFLARSYNLGATAVGIFFALIGLGLTVGFGFLVKRVTQFPPKKIVAIGYGILLIAIIFTLIPYPIMPWLVVIPGTAGLATGYANALALFSNQVTEDKQGWVMGVSVSLVAFAAGFAILIATVLSDIHLSLPLIVAIGFLLIGSILVLSYRPNERR